MSENIKAKKIKSHLLIKETSKKSKGSYAKLRKAKEIIKALRKRN